MWSERSEEINEIAAALAKAQGQMENAPFDRTNPHFRSKYASLASVVNAGRKALSENGIAVSQLINNGNLTTLMMHASGQWLSSTMSLPVTPRPQELGSALTYFRRYHLSSIMGISADDDDDANAAEEAAKRGNGRRAPPPPGENVMHKHQLSTGGPYDPETGEVRQEEVDSSPARPSPAPPAPALEQTGAGGSTLSDPAIANIRFLATEAAKRGREQLNVYFKGLPPEGKRIVTLMQAELEKILPPKTP
jgi:hypothetical protein